MSALLRPFLFFVRPCNFVPPTLQRAVQKPHCSTLCKRSLPASCSCSVDRRLVRLRTEPRRGDEDDASGGKAPCATPFASTPAGPGAAADSAACEDEGDEEAAELAEGRRGAGRRGAGGNGDTFTLGRRGGLPSGRAALAAERSRETARECCERAADSLCSARLCQNQVHKCAPHPHAPWLLAKRPRWSAVRQRESTRSAPKAPECGCDGAQPCCPTRRAPFEAELRRRPPRQRRPVALPTSRDGESRSQPRPRGGRA